MVMSDSTTVVNFDRFHRIRKALSVMKPSVALAKDESKPVDGICRDLAQRLGLAPYLVTFQLRHFASGAIFEAIRASHPEFR